MTKFVIEVTVAAIQEIEAESLEEAFSRLSNPNYDVIENAIAYRIDDDGKLLYEVEYED